jgi:hypothetical protein
LKWILYARNRAPVAASGAAIDILMSMQDIAWLREIDERFGCGNIGRAAGAGFDAKIAKTKLGAPGVGRRG